MTWKCCASGFFHTFRCFRCVTIMINWNSWSVPAVWSITIVLATDLCWSVGRRCLTRCRSGDSSSSSSSEASGAPPWLPPSGLGHTQTPTLLQMSRNHPFTHDPQAGSFLFTASVLFKCFRVWVLFVMPQGLCIFTDTCTQENTHTHTHPAPPLLHHTLFCKA